MRYPIATPPPIVRFRTCVVFSMRSAAAFSAWATRSTSLAPDRRHHADIAQRTELLLEATDALSGIDQFVAHGERRRHGETGIADFAELAAKAFDPRLEAFGQIDELALLAFLAGHAV